MLHFRCCFSLTSLKFILIAITWCAVTTCKLIFTGWEKCTGAGTLIDGDSSRSSLGRLRDLCFHTLSSYQTRSWSHTGHQVKLWEKMYSRTGAWTRDPRITVPMFYRLTNPQPLSPFPLLNSDSPLISTSSPGRLRHWSEIIRVSKNAQP